MGLRRTDILLPEPIITQFTEEELCVSLSLDELTFWDLNKMTAILQIAFSNASFGKKYFSILNFWSKIAMNNPGGLIDHKSTLVQVTTFCQSTSHYLTKIHVVEWHH